MGAFRRGKLRIRGSLHVGVGFLAATSGATEESRLTFESVRTRRPAGSRSCPPGAGKKTLICAHGLGGTKASFLPTVAALAEHYRVVAVDLPGFGESDKPIGAPYNAPYFARVGVRADGRARPRQGPPRGQQHGRPRGDRGRPMDEQRVESLVLLSPALAWLRDRRWAPIVKALRPELGLLQIAPRPIVEGVVRRFVGAQGGWADAGVDEFLRAYLTPRGRAAFYAAARSIYLDEPHGEDGFWTRMAELAPRSLFVWGRSDTLVPIAFMKHVEDCLPAAKHLELECGHVPQLEAPRETHAAIAHVLRLSPAALALRARDAVQPSAWTRIRPDRGFHRMVQAMRVTAQPYGFMAAPLAPLRRRVQLALPDLRPRGLRGRPGGDQAGVRRRPPTVSTRARRTPSRWATRSASTRCSRSTRAAT